MKSSIATRIYNEIPTDLKLFVDTYSETIINRGDTEYMIKHFCLKYRTKKLVFKHIETFKKH